MINYSSKKQIFVSLILGEYKTTMSSYHDIEHILAHLDAQDQEMLRLRQCYTVKNCFLLGA